MRRIAAPAALVLALVGCDRSRSDFWHQKFLNEVNLHYQTQQTKNAEIAARDLEVENQRAFMKIMSDRIETLEKSREGELDKLRHRILELRGPLAPVSGVITSVAGEIGVVVLNVGRDRNLVEGDEFEIVREGKPVVRVRLDRVDQKWSGAKVIGGGGSPLKGDRVELVQPEKPK